MTGEVALRSGDVDREAVLRHLQLDPRNPATQALLLVCERYGLDPLLKHMLLIQGRPYVTRDGYLHLAHQSGRLDGIEILDEGEDDDHWWAKVAVHRKDMARPFTYRGRYPKQGAGNAKYGPEMAIKCAEVAALRRAFNVTGIGAADEKWDADDVHTVDVPAFDRQRADTNVVLAGRVADLPDDLREAFLDWKAGHEFPFEAGVGYELDAVASMNARLDEIEAGGTAVSESGSELEPPLAPELLPADEEEALTRTPCSRCTSTRTNRVRTASGEVVCEDRAGCDRRTAVYRGAA